MAFAAALQTSPGVFKASAPAVELESSIGRLEDTELVEQLCRGESEALSELFKRHSSLLHALALRILHSQQDAEEVVQEVFLYAWRKAASYDASRSSVSSWLVVITRSRSLDRLRSSQRVENLRSEVDRQRDVGKPNVSEGFRHVLNEERADRLRQAMSRLPEPQREVLEFSYYHGWTQKEVAERKGIPIGTVKTRTFLALRKLRRELSSEIRQLI